MYERAFVEGFYVLRWCGHELEDVPQILNDVVACHARFGAPIVYVAVQPADAPPVSTAVRAARNNAIGALLAACERVHLVIEGDSPALVHTRKSASAVLEAKQLARRVLVHASVDEVVDATPEDARGRARTALRVARSRGVL